MVFFLQLDIFVPFLNGEWFVYIHEKGHLVHNSMYNFGNVPSYTTLNINQSVVTVHEIQRTEVSYLDESRTPCQSKPRDEEMNHCIQHFIEKEIGCQLPWYLENTTLPKCTQAKQYRDFLSYYDKIASLNGFSIARKTECLPSCKINEFSMEVKNRIVMPDGGSTYNGYFYYPSGRYKQKVYYYTYDFTSYIADIGGLVGLFLGFSMLSIYDGLKTTLKNKML